MQVIFNFVMTFISLTFVKTYIFNPF